MPILLIRHAKAEVSNEAGDWARALTAGGRRVFRRNARRLASLLPVKGIASSPYVRSVQTAEILAAGCGISQVKVCSELAPNRRAAERIVRLALELGTDWALVGHNPSLTEALALALGVVEIPWTLKKGAAVALRRRGNGFTFEWLAAPGAEITRHP